MRTTRALVVWTLGLLAAGCLQAAREDPVQWTLQPVKGFERVKPGAAAWLELTATIQPGWHLYSPTTPPGGPIPTKIEELTPNAAVTGAKVWRQQPVRRLDPNFNIDTETYADSAIFYIQADTKPGSSGPITFEASAYYQACSDVKCLRPVTKSASAAVTGSTLARKNALAKRRKSSCFHFSVLWSWHWAHWICTPRKTRDALPAEILRRLLEAERPVDRAVDLVEVGGVLVRLLRAPRGRRRAPSASPAAPSPSRPPMPFWPVAETRSRTMRSHGAFASKRARSQ